MQTILAIEDNPADRKLLLHLFKACSVPHQLCFAKDGEEALDYLFRRGTFAHAVRPDLILLDLSMPKKDGRDVLKEVKSTPALRRIPVIVLTTSSSDHDVNQAYEFHANSYIQKPRDLKKFQAIISAIEQYWLSTVELPRFDPHPYS